MDWNGYSEHSSFHSGLRFASALKLTKSTMQKQTDLFDIAMKKRRNGSSDN